MKLVAIDPIGLALFVERELEQKRVMIHGALSLDGKRAERPTIPDRQRGRSDAAKATRELYAFARGGTTLEGTPGAAAHVIAELTLHFLWRWFYAPSFQVRRVDRDEELFAYPIAAGGDSPDEAALVTVMLAARGRLRLARRRTITGPELQALAGYDPATVSRLCRGGRITRVGTNRHDPFYAVGAEALLAGIGVPGF